MLNAYQQIRQRLTVARLAAMPQVLIKLLELCQRENATVSLDDYAALISKDAAVTMKILGAAQHSAPTTHHYKPELQHALQFLGMDGVKALLISESISQGFEGVSHTGNTDLRGFWRHAYTAALAARKIAAVSNYAHPEEAYLAGLLHDIGRLALFSVAPQEYSTLLRHVDDASLCVAEQHTFGMTHPEAGAWLIEQFSLDSFLADSVLYHHQPAEQLVAAHPLIRIAMLADLIATHGASEPTLAVAQLLFGMDAKALQAIYKDTEERVRETAEALSIDLTDTEQSMAGPDTTKHASNARLQLAHEVQQVILAAEVGRTFAGADSELGVMSAVIKSARLQFGFETALFLMSDEDGQYLQGVVLENSRQSIAEFSLPLRKGGAIPDALEQGQIVFLNAISTTLTLAEDQLFRLLGADHLVCLPLRVDQRGQTGRHGLGVIIASVSAVRLDEVRHRINFLRTFASQAATAIENVHVKGAESARIAEKYRQAASLVVHEASNPLSIIKNYLAVLEIKLAKQEPVKAEIAILSQEIDRVGQILRGLSDIQLEPSKEVIGIKQIVADVVRFLRVTGFVPPSIHLETRFQTEMAELNVDGNALKQILINLIKNAVEAIQGSGEIVVAIPGYINRDGRLYCTLTVHDNGPGIAPPVLAKLFSPVRSTKGGDHAGLGLSIVHGLVQSLAGMIMCRSNGSGTTFELLLPVSSVTNNEIETESQPRKHIGESYGRT